MRAYCKIWLLISALVIFAGPAKRAVAADAMESLRADYLRLVDGYRAAEPEWFPKPPATGSLMYVAPDEYSPADAPGKEVTAAQVKYADALFELAKRAADAGELSLAFQWATEAVRSNPDHADARRVLGYEQREGRWLTAYGAKMFDAGKVWNAQRGWNSREATKTSTVDDAKDAARHADLKNGWQVRTDHFLVTTNESLAAAATLAARLERLYQIWRQRFAGFYYTEKEVRGLFAGERNARVQARPFRVFYYRNRDEYVDALRRRQPRIAETLGIYFDTTHEAFFFNAKPLAAAGMAAESATGEPLVATNIATGAATATLYHEAVHQLFQESKPAAKRIAANANFWVVEGVANYFETLTEHTGGPAGLYYTVGETTAGRLPAARGRLREGYYVPLAELTKLNKDELQRRPDAAKLYSQSTGLAAFLIDGYGGRYREPFVRYLQAVYAGRDNAGTLAELTGTSYAELDAAYRRFLESLP